MANKERVNPKTGNGKVEIILIPIISILILVVLGVIAVYPNLFEHYAKNHIDTEMESKFQNVRSANIGVITVNQHDGMKGYSAGASGVIFSKKDNRYFALTAYHVVKDKDGYLIHTVNSETVSEYRRNNPDKPRLEDYYNSKIAAKLEYMNEESDLAILSFTCDEDLAVIPIADELPEKNDKIMAVSNLNGEFFHITYGKIMSNKLSAFSTDDGQSDNRVLHHSAYVAPGSSGGAVINDEMKLTGINIGGAVDIFGRFKHGVLIPFDQIQKVVENALFNQ